MDSTMFSQLSFPGWYWSALWNGYQWGNENQTCHRNLEVLDWWYTYFQYGGSEFDYTKTNPQTFFNIRSSRVILKVENPLSIQNVTLAGSTCTFASDCKTKHQ